MRKDLIEKINNAIEVEAVRTGKMGTENVSVTLVMTDREIDIFKVIETFDSENYTWDIDGNELNITYTEEV